jgi:hypothetical protein
MCKFGQGLLFRRTAEPARASIRLILPIGPFGSWRNNGLEDELRHATARIQKDFLPAVIDQPTNDFTSVVAINDSR